MTQKWFHLWGHYLLVLEISPGIRTQNSETQERGTLSLSILRTRRGWFIITTGGTSPTSAGIRFRRCLFRSKVQWALRDWALGVQPFTIRLHDRVGYNIMTRTFWNTDFIDLCSRSEVFQKSDPDFNKVDLGVFKSKVKPNRIFNLLLVVFNSD